MEDQINHVVHEAVSLPFFLAKLPFRISGWLVDEALAFVVEAAVWAPDRLEQAIAHGVYARRNVVARRA